MSYRPYQMITRRKSRQIRVGKVLVGGDAPITVQTMTNTPTEDAAATIAQIRKSEVAGVDIVRVSCPTPESTAALAEIVREVNVPIVADIHFHYRRAIEAAKAGAACLRINPGNIGGRDRVKAVVDKAGALGIPIRIGVNGGSLEKDLLEQFGSATPEAMVASALRHIEVLEREGFHAIKISLKASDVVRTVQAYRLLARQVDYPFHLGITEAGTPFGGTIRSSVGMGILLAEGLGDTIRVSLTGEGEDECRVGHELLRSLALRQGGFRMVSCPSCGRVQIDLNRVAHEIEEGLKQINHENITYAVMGCVVNGPGEAKDADLGVAGGAGEGLIYRKGELIRKVKEEDLVPAFLEEARKVKAEADAAKG